MRRVKWLDWISGDIETKELRVWQAERQHGLAEFCDFAFRCVEMTFVLGAVRFFEIKSGSPALASTVLQALIAIYVRGKVASALYPVVDRYDLTELARKWLWVGFWFFGFVAFFASNRVVAAALPLIEAKP